MAGRPPNIRPSAFFNRLSAAQMNGSGQQSLCVDVDMAFGEAADTVNPTPELTRASAGVIWVIPIDDLDGCHSLLSPRELLAISGCFFSIFDRNYRIRS